MAKDTFYFSHDYNTRTDEKIQSLLMKHGMVGYGIFWAIIEDLYNNANALRTHYERIAYDLRVDEKIVKSVINDFDLFVFNGDLFGSLSIESRIDERNKKSAKARESAYCRWNKDANASNDDANAMRKGEKTEKRNAIKERKVNKSKVKDKKTIPSIDEFMQYFRDEIKPEKNIDEFAIKAKYDSWVDAGWKDGHGNDIKNWKSKLKNTVIYMPVNAADKQPEKKKQVIYI